MALGDNGGKAPNYEPNSYEMPRSRILNMLNHRRSDTTVDRFDREGNDDYTKQEICIG